MKVTFADAVKSGFLKFRVFKGTSSRPEYWYFVLFSVLLSIVLGTVEALVWPPAQTEDIMEALQQPTPLSNVAALVLLVPSLAVTSRRIRDAGWSGKWLWALLLPVIPFVFGAVGTITYLESVASPSIEDLASLISYFVPAVLLAVMVQIFLLVLCLRPSKSKESGNRYAE
jgi:uncharacterized membrane protein YhaH (DUF805 family)